MRETVLANFRLESDLSSSLVVNNVLSCCSLSELILTSQVAFELVFIFKLKSLLQVFDHVRAVLRVLTWVAPNRLIYFFVQLIQNFCASFTLRYEIDGCVMLSRWMVGLRILNLGFLRTRLDFFWLISAHLSFYGGIVDLRFFFLSVHSVQ